MDTAGNASTKSTSRPTTPSNASSSTDGPVLNLINKRIRAIRKKLNRITQMEEAVASGKSLNKEQQDTLSTKPSLLAQIDELEKLKPSLQSAVAEEHSLAVKLHHQSEPSKAVSESGPSVDLISDLLNLLYFGSIFDVKTHQEYTSTMLTRTHERGCCLTYDYVTDEAVDLLGEKDLDFISKLSCCLISRPVDSGLSHKGALERCVEYAKLWLEKSEQPIGADSDVTYAGLREKLNKIMASEYMTITPEIQVPEFGSFEVPLQMQGGNVGGQGEGGVTHYEQQQDEGAHYQGQEFALNESTPLEVLQVEAAEDHYEGSLHQEQSNQGTEVEDSHRDSEQYVQRRGYINQGYQNPRGGRGNRRGSFNGRGPRGGNRGGGQYQNGGRGQYYDQPGNYYPRNNNRRRGAGRGAGGNGYNNYGGNAHAGHSTGDVGVAS